MGRLLPLATVIRAHRQQSVRDKTESKMSMADSILQPDSPEAREYNRARRWLEIGDMVIGFGFLVGLLATGWTGKLRDLATRISGDRYAIRLFLYVLFLSVLSKALGIALDFYGFRLEIGRAHV